MKQTAVEWLYNNLKSHFEHDGDLLEIVQMSFEQAKAMEKEKLEQFYNHGQWAVIENGHGECFEDYYNRTFKSE